MSRLLRIELRRNTMVWMLPVVGALFWFLAYRRSMALPPLWNVRAMTMQGLAVAVFIPTVAGAAAWTASREARRSVTDLLAVTARPRWARQAAAWAATTAWSLICYGVCVGILYGITARQATGGPLWWPAIVGAASLPALSALGFAAGALVPSRFTPPLVAVGTFVALEVSLELIHGPASRWQISPLVAGPFTLSNDEGLATFYRYLPDLAITQRIFLVGLTAALLGILGLPVGSGGRWLRGSAAVLTVSGLVLAGAGVTLAGTGRLDPHGMVAIPALHNAADDRPIAYTPLCSHTPIPVCLNPAYAVYLDAVATALQPLLTSVAGLPGAPVRISQAATTYRDSGHGIEVRAARSGLSGTPPVYWFVLPNQFSGPTMSVHQCAAVVRTDAMRRIVTAVVGDGSDPAQQAVAAVLLGRSDPAPGSAAARFAALSPTTRHTWLMTHASDLRAGLIALDELP
jgi:hypothetical protein